jgi:PKD repeat protein
MKKLILPILFLFLTLQGISQFFLTVQGTVTNTSNGNPVAYHSVTIHNDSVPTGTYFYHTVNTDINGVYFDTIPIGAGGTQGNLYVTTYDCNNVQQMQSFTYSPAQTFITADFAICVSSNPCMASFTYQQTQPYEVNFYDLSVGGGTARSWDFGDGSPLSTATNPVHTYAQPGFYNVTLTIGALGTTCYNSMTLVINVWGNTGGCQASFYSYPDSTTSNLVYFSNQSTGNILTYSWEFGDGTTSSLMNPSHQYQQAGTYNVCLTVQGTDSLCFDVLCQIITVGSGSNCQAAFTIIPDSSGVLAYQFIDQSVGNISQWTWSFGDGTIQTVTFPQNPNVAHTYNASGIYGVMLTVTGDNGACIDYHFDTLYVGYQPGCQAFFSYFDSLNTGNPLQFIDQSTGNITSWSWNFGDPVSGANNTSSLQYPTHYFSSPGLYNVCLTVQGVDSTCFDTYCTTVIVGGGPLCQANFTYAVNPAPGNYTVTFTDLSIGNPTAWQWSFGDGSAGSGQNPIHTYAGAGTYPVTLTISGNNCTSTFTMAVVVPDSTNYHQVYGQVFAGNFPISMGMVMIFSIDSSNTLPYFGASTLDSNGVYYFTLVPDGNYYILAIPFDSNGYLPTYYGNTINWEQATVISLGTPNNPYNINLVQADQMISGPGSTSGQINMGDVNSAMLDKINMIIMNDQNSPIGFTQVSTTGTFNFPSLAYGTYYLHPEMPGVTSDVIMITLSQEKPHVDVVMTFTGSNILGLQDAQSLVNQWSVYPNPVADQLSISLNLKKELSVNAQIYSITGQLMASKSAMLQNGNNTISMTTSDLQAGIYLLRITSKEGVNLQTKLVKTR